MHGGYELWEFVLKLVFLSLTPESVKGKGGTYVEEKGYVPRSLEGQEEDL